MQTQFSSKNSKAKMLLMKVVIVLGCCTFLIVAKRKKANKTVFCKVNDIEDPSRRVSFDEFQCGKRRNGEYSHEIDLKDGTIHREKGIIQNGVFSIYGFTRTKAEPDVSCFESLLESR